MRFTEDTKHQPLGEAEELAELQANRTLQLKFRGETLLQFWILVKREFSVLSADSGFSYAYRVLVGRPEGKRPLGRPRRRWEDNIKMDLREVGYDDRDWINLAQDKDRWRAYVRAAMNLRVP
ncbi:hypothetical protein ANN_09794 [Periplaneta americana]|uniref:Uncharacterized protein n=1 Tax=Periplaneta americana TaxID=6978 RepID=A0ABQ8TNS2_PERAM|nr:hypothetical protein ANN_09794 [Periplaneta americana]